MATNYLDTGDTGRAVSSESDGALFAGIFGAEKYVLENGSQLKAEIQSNNIVKISDGYAVMYGRHVRIPANDSALVTINNGHSGTNRIDLIVFRYTKDSTGKETVDLVVIQGEDSTGTAIAPTAVDGNILTGAMQSDFPLYSVELNGINIVKVNQLFNVIGNISKLKEELTELNSNLGNVKADLTKANNNIAIINSNLISIVERGTKNNYNYTKYSNGDMVMWSKYTWNTNLATSWYNWYFASSAAVGFPVAFKQEPLIIVSPAKTNELYGLGVTEVTTTGYKLTAYSPKQGMCYVQADMLIIGKWK